MLNSTLMCNKNILIVAMVTKMCYSDDRFSKSVQVSRGKKRQIMSLLKNAQRNLIL